MTVGVPCPSCGVSDNHEAVWYSYDEETKEPVEIRLHCARCEHVWTEVMT